MTRKNKILSRTSVLFLILLWSFQMPEIQACSRKRVAPEWVNTHLSDPEYFIGIGSAPIIKKQNTHIEKARQDALNELASEISIQLFSSNVLVTLVKNDKIKDEFNTLIRSRVSAEIEGYELVDTYADKKNYWVYYRLSKQKYYEQQQAKRQAAVHHAASYVKLARASEKKGDLKYALINYAKTVDAVKLYLNEDIVVSIDGEDENPVAFSFDRLNAILSSLNIKPARSEIHVLLSGNIEQDALTFSLCDAGGKPVAGFPLIAYYSERAMQEASALTDHEGAVRFSVGKVRSAKNEEVFRVMPDVNAILQESLPDFVVRKAILDIPVHSVSVPIYIAKPSIRFEVKEKNPEFRSLEDLLLNTLFNLSKLSGYTLNTTSADYICSVETNTQQQSFNNGIYTCMLTGTITLLDPEKKVRYVSEIMSVKGMQLNRQKAAAEAYNLLSRQINSRYFREVEEAIRK